jgi:hypothetical protein
MSDLTLYGSVLPQANLLTVPFDTDLRFDDPDSDLVVYISISIRDSQVVAKCSRSERSHASFTYAYLRALDMARAIVDVAAFSLGDGLTVLLTDIAEDNGERKPIRIHDPALPPLCASMLAEGRYQDICRLVISDSRIVLALNDLIAANMNQHLASINCARAVEGLRHIISPGKKRVTSWAGLRAALRVDESYLRLITENSIPHRHGDRLVKFEAPLTKKIMQRSWTIMDRFFEYSLRGRHPLPLSEFPLLKG